MRRVYGIARCSLGHWGFITHVAEVTYPNGEKAWAFCGRHLLPLRLLGKPWSSRWPKKWLVKPR